MKIERNDLDYIVTFEKYQTVIDEANIAIWEWNLKENKLFTSPAWEKITEYPLNTFNDLPRCIRKLVIDEDKESALSDLNSFMEGKVSLYKSEFRIITKTDQIKWISIRGNIIKGDNGEVVLLIGLLNDITEEKKSRKVLAESMYYDFLTKLPNRDLFLFDFKNILNETIHHNKDGALIFIDVDNFKTINDTLGHDYGDLLLKAFSRLLKICISDYGKLYRVGGDEFIALIDKFDFIGDIKDICNTILDYCNNPFVLNEKQSNITVGIGISIFPQDSNDMNELLKFVDLAMFKSKSFGKNTYTFFEQALSKSYTRRIVIENELKEAINKNELYIVYQPQIYAVDNTIVAFEALLRWKNEKLGIVSPAEFIPIAEETGLIVEIGDWVLNKVCKKIRELKDKNYRFNNIAINVSPIQIKETNFKDKIMKVCEEYKIPLSSLEIEITESTLIELDKKKIADLHEMIEKDINISIDDFGTGYSSLSYLTVLPINTLKIDKSFIDNIENEKNRAVIECILNLSKSLKYEVIAEGVEIKKQLQMLMNLGCNIIQGYYFSKPVGEDEVEEMLRNNQGRV